MATVWFTTPTSTPTTGRGRLRAASLVGLSIDGPRTVRRQRPVRAARPVGADAKAQPALAHERSHRFPLADAAR